MPEQVQSPCPGEETLLAFASGNLGATRFIVAEAHLAACEECARVVGAVVASMTPPGELALEQLQVGDLLAGKYRIEHRLGQGGMGLVLAATHLELGHRVALKVLTSREPSAAARFLREGKASARLVSEHIVRVFDLGRLREGVPYLVMEYLEGEDLARLVTRGPLPLQSALEYVRQACAGLERAHAAGVVHRDLKPSNLFLTRRADGSPCIKLLDFGIAKFVARGPLDITGGITLPEAMIGSPMYMSPEQVRGLAVVDARSDIWSLGVVLYELLTGSAPFRGPQLSPLLMAIVLEAPRPPSSLLPGLPPEVEALILRCLEKTPSARFASVQELRLALEAQLSSCAGVPQVDVARVEAADVAASPLEASRELALRPAQSDSQPAQQGSERSQRAERTPLVGREPDLRRLSELLDESLSGAGRVVFLTGEAGSGKTALSDAFARSAQQRVPGLLLATGHCLEHFSPAEAHAPFLEVIESLLAGDAGQTVARLLEAHAPTWCLQFPERFSDAETLQRLRRVTIGATHERMLRELGRVLGELSALCPLLIRLEDLHWADPASIDDLRLLCRSVRCRRLLLLATFRSDALERYNEPLHALQRETLGHQLSTELRLASLSVQDIEQFSRSCLGGLQLPVELPEFLQRKTGGLPLFVTRLVQHLVDSGHLGRVADTWQLTRDLPQLEQEVPESIRWVIERKLDSLGSEARRTLQYASIEGQEFTSVVLARLLDTDEAVLQERLRQLEQIHRLVVELGDEPLSGSALTSRYRFTHVLYQNVLYEELVSQRKRRLHVAVAEALVGCFPERAVALAAQVARHFEQGGNLGSAAEYWLHCADHAARAFAYREAIQQLDHVIALIGGQPAPSDQRRCCLAYYKRAWAQVHARKLTDAVRDLQMARGHARAIGDQELEGAALTGLCHVAVLYEHDRRQSDAFAREALQLAESSGDQGIALVATAHIAGQTFLGGDSDTAEPQLLQVVSEARRLGHQPALVLGLGFLGLLHFSRSEFERADELLSETTTYDVALRDAFVVITALYSAASSRAHLGRIDSALASYEQALAWAQGNGDPVRLPMVLSALGWLYAEIGQHSLAADFARRSACCKDPASGAWGLVASQLNLLEPDLNSIPSFGQLRRASESDEARAALLELERGLRQQPWWHWSFHLRAEACRCQHALHENDLADAERRALSLLDAATSHRAAKYVAIAHRVLAEVHAARGDLLQAKDEIQAALAAVGGGMPLLAWRLHAGQGRIARELGDTIAARGAYAAAAALLRLIADNIGDDGRRRAFLASDAAREVYANCDDEPPARRRTQRSC